MPQDAFFFRCDFFTMLFVYMFFFHGLAIYCMTCSPFLGLFFYFAFGTCIFFLTRYGFIFSSWWTGLLGTFWWYSVCFVIRVDDAFRGGFFFMTRFHDEDFGFAVRNYFPFISLRYWGFLYVFCSMVFFFPGH